MSIIEIREQKSKYQQVIEERRRKEMKEGRDGREVQGRDY